MQNYKLELSDHALKVLEKISRREPELCKRLSHALDELETNPQQGKPLKGELKGKYSYRVGPYRIIYRNYQTKLLVIDIDTGHRREIYR